MDVPSGIVNAANPSVNDHEEGFWLRQYSFQPPPYLFRHSRLALLLRPIWPQA